MLSLLAVFKDVLPGYRIRLPTEKELAMPVSKDVKRTRDYEATLLRLYQVHFHTRVAEHCKPCYMCKSFGHPIARWVSMFVSDFQGMPCRRTCGS